MSPAADMPVDYDLTEVEGVDDLHHAGGILREAMERTAQLFGAKRTWYLVGGSTVGNLAGIRAIAPYGSEVIVARNCHKSVYHAIELGNLTVHWIWPEYDSSYGIFGSVRPETVERALQQYPASRGVILTSPTYEGVISDIRSIAALCHAHFCTDQEVNRTGIPLLVDEAHGAHLGLFAEGGFPASALRCGADIVVQSAHKTLPSLTQTALLHLGGGSETDSSRQTCLVNEEEIEQQLNIFETSSPSYPLMCSLDGCTGLLRNNGREWFRKWGDALDTMGWKNGTHPCRNLRILCQGQDSVTDHPALYAFDKSKILISSRGCTWKADADRRLTAWHRQEEDHYDRQSCSSTPGGMPDEISGREVADILRNSYHMETEMHMGSNVLCMTSCADDFTMYDRLMDALHDIDAQMEHGTDSADNAQRNSARRPGPGIPVQPDSPMTIAEALRHPASWLPEEKSIGHIAAEYIYPYPPGIPVIVPGEVITTQSLILLHTLANQGSTLIHTGGDNHSGNIRVASAGN